MYRDATYFKIFDKAELSNSLKSCFNVGFFFVGSNDYVWFKELGNFKVQGVRKILPDGKVDSFFLESGYSIKARQAEERVSVATMLVQYTCQRRCVVKHRRN